MIQEFKNRFLQGMLLTIIWVMLLTSLTFGNQTVELDFFWRIIGISALMSFLFSVVYKYIWNYGTWIAPINIIVTSGVNFVSGYLTIYLYSRDLWELMLPYWWLVLMVTVLLHILGFYFWSRFQNKKIASDLNHLTK